MPIHLQFGRSSRGTLGLRQVPVYDVSSWHAEYVGDDKLVCRPTMATLRERLSLTLAAAILLGLQFWTYGLPWQDSSRESRRPVATVAAPGEYAREMTRQLEQRLPPAKWREFQEAASKRQQQLELDIARVNRQRSVRHIQGSVLYWAAVWGLTALAVLPLLLVSIERVTVERNLERELVIRKFSLWPTKRRVPLEAIAGILVGPDEVTTQIRTRRIHKGWRWIARIVGGTASSPAHGILDQLDITFWLQFQKQRPNDPSCPPLRVRQFVQSLCKISGIADVSYAIPGEAFGHPGTFGWPVQTKVFECDSPVRTQQHVFRSLDDVPDSLRDEVQQLMQESRRSGRDEVRTIRVTVRDIHGNERTYHSLEEMPADVRARYEQNMRSSRRRPDVP